MGAAGVAAPEAVLTQLVAAATQAAVAEAAHAVAPAVGAGDGMEDWQGEQEETRHPSTSRLQTQRQLAFLGAVTDEEWSWKPHISLITSEIAGVKNWNYWESPASLEYKSLPEPLLLYDLRGECSSN